MALLTKEQIFSKEDKKYKEVEVPEWGGTVRVTVMSGGDKDRWEGGLLGKNGNINYTNMRAKMVAYCCVDENGKRLFSDDDIIKLSKKSAIALERVYTACAEINVITEADVEDLAKN